MNESKSSIKVAYKLLQLSFVFLLFMAGVDKFFNILVFWPQYIPKLIDDLVPMTSAQMMYGAGVLELFCAFLVYFKPRLGAVATVILFASIIANLALVPGYFNIILLDFVLMFHASALGFLSSKT